MLQFGNIGNNLSFKVKVIPLYKLQLQLKSCKTFKIYLLFYPMKRGRIRYILPMVCKEVEALLPLFLAQFLVTWVKTPPNNTPKNDFRVL